MFNVEKKKVKTLFNDTHRFVIPDFQRGYVWGDEEIDEFFEDLTSESLFFIGSFIFKITEDKKDIVEIIDGQQRTVTLSLFYAALSLLLEKIADLHDDVATDARLIAHELRKHIAEVDPQKPSKISKFKIDFKNIDTNNFFASLLSLKDIEKLETKNDLQKRIKKIYIKLIDLISEHTKLNYERVVNLREQIEDTEIIAISITKEEMAYQIFETVNARGVDLTVADLLKNHLFRTITDHERLKNKWENITDNLQQTGSKKLDLSASLRFYWISTFEHITKRKLYRAIKEAIAKKRINEENLLEEIYKFSENITLLYSQDQNTWLNNFKKTSAEKRQAIRWFHYKNDSIRVFEKSTQYLPILTALLNKKDIIDITNGAVRKLIHLIESINFMYLEVSNQPGNLLEKKYSEYSRKINKSKNKDEVIKHISSLCIELNKLLADKTNKELLVKRLSELRYTRKRDYLMIMFILTKIEYLLSDFGAITNYANISAEHISSQSKTNTKEGLPESVVHQLGNLTMMQFTGATGNGALNDLPFTEKAETYGESPYALTRHLKSYSEWNVASAGTRLVNIADIVWNIWGPDQITDSKKVKELLKSLDLI